MLSSCATTRITSAQTATLVSAEKLAHSTNYIVCIQGKDGSRYSGYYNSHCYNCNAIIPHAWSVVVKKNGKAFFQPIR